MVCICTTHRRRRGGEDLHARESQVKDRCVSAPPPWWSPSALTSLPLDRVQACKTDNPTTNLRATRHLGATLASEWLLPPSFASVCVSGVQAWQTPGMGLDIKESDNGLSRTSCSKTEMSSAPSLEFRSLSSLSFCCSFCFAERGV